MRRSVRPTATMAVLLAFSAATAAYGITTSRTADDGVVDSALDEHGHLHSQHGDGAGHLPARSSDDLRLVGKMRINQDFEGRVSDVSVLDDHAYLGAFSERNCQKGGTYVFDISDPTAPKQINFVRAQNDSYVGEGVHVVRLDTDLFEGDVLAQNLEICGKTKIGAQGGFNLFDVSNPKTHKLLAHAGDYTEGSSVAHTYHSVFMWQDGGSAYLVGVDNEEGADVDIYDITDPRAPELIAEYDLNADESQIIDDVKGSSESFLHDMVVEEIDGRQVMLASYWDGGYVTLDVTDPTDPLYLADSDFEAVDPVLAAANGDSRVPEGNAHQAEFSLADDLIVAADEDFDPFALLSTNVTDGTTFSAGQGSDTPALQTGEERGGTSRFVGLACASGSVPPADGAAIAVVERGVCDFTVKVANVEQQGGYEAILVVNRTAADGCESTLGMLVEGSTPTFGVAPRSLAYSIFDAGDYDQAACEAGDGTQLLPIAVGALGDTLSFEAYFDGWGYVRLFANETDADGKLVELDQYAIEEAHDEDKAVGFGDLSVHEVAMSHVANDVAYLSYYAGGVRVLGIEDGQLVERAAFIDEGGSNVWGVEVFEHEGREYVAASDRDFGLYILEYLPVND